MHRRKSVTPGPEAHCIVVPQALASATKLPTALRIENIVTPSFSVWDAGAAASAAAAAAAAAVAVTAATGASAPDARALPQHEMRTVAGTPDAEAEATALSQSVMSGEESDSAMYERHMKLEIEERRRYLCKELAPEQMPTRFLSDPCVAQRDGPLLPHTQLDYICNALGRPVVTPRRRATVAVAASALVGALAGGTAHRGASGRSARTDSSDEDFVLRRSSVSALSSGAGTGSVLGTRRRRLSDGCTVRPAARRLWSDDYEFGSLSDSSDQPPRRRRASATPATPTVPRSHSLAAATGGDASVTPGTVDGAPPKRKRGRPPKVRPPEQLGPLAAAGAGAHAVGAVVAAVALHPLPGELSPAVVSGGADVPAVDEWRAEMVTLAVSAGSPTAVAVGALDAGVRSCEDAAAAAAAVTGAVGASGSGLAAGAMTGAADSVPGGGAEKTPRIVLRLRRVSRAK